jgi:hypothetical protein
MKRADSPATPSAAPPKRITLERVYRADVQDVWDLWTTKDGIESWWGPGGFVVTVRKLDLRAGGELLYAMTAIDPPQVAFMKKSGMPVTHECRITFSEVVPLRRRISEEVLLRYNGMLASTFELLADSREQVAAVAAAIDHQREFWVAEADLNTALVGRSPGAGEAGFAIAAPRTAAAAGGH